VPPTLGIVVERVDRAIGGGAYAFRPLTPAAEPGQTEPSILVSGK